MDRMELVVVIVTIKEFTSWMLVNQKPLSQFLNFSLQVCQKVAAFLFWIVIYLYICGVFACFQILSTFKFKHRHKPKKFLQHQNGVDGNNLHTSVMIVDDNLWLCPIISVELQLLKEFLEDDAKFYVAAGQQHMKICFRRMTLFLSQSP